MRFVGCDSGPMHVAWASGMPVVLLAGPQDELRTGPWPPGRNGSPSHRVVRATPSPPCAPCLARVCHHPEGPVCMTRIDAADIVRASG
jgi:ADP-heptose:LPS heptosyltransferase